MTAKNEGEALSVLEARPSATVQLVNRAARLLRFAGLMSLNASSEKLMAAAKSKTGLSDFGEDEFEAELDEFVRCFHDEPRLNYTGVAGLKSMVVNALERRLTMQREFTVHPEILEKRIERPVFVVGFPRSGTTLMQNLLIQHPGCRWLEPWETLTPFPANDEWGGERDGRVGRLQAMAAKVKKEFPLQDEIHSWDNPGECWLLLYATFVAPQLLGSVVIERYRKWWEGLPEEAFEKAYRYYRKQLQYLIWQRGGTHWVLKETSHMTELDQLLACFPDGRIVQTHRDPVECMGSMCSLIYYQFRCFDTVRGVTPGEVGRLLLDAYSAWAAKNVALRQRLGGGSFYDVWYPQFVKEPLNIVRKIYQYFGMEFSEGMKRNIETWLAAHHSTRRSRHSYRLEDFGLDAGRVKEAFKPYCEYFNL